MPLHPPSPAAQTHSGQLQAVLDIVLSHQGAALKSALLQRLGEHPSIVRWQGLYRGSTQMALVLELVSGGDCQQLLQRHGCLAESAVHAMISQLRGAVEHLHSQQVLHLDLKSLNLLLCNDDTIKVCDFGLAKVKEQNASLSTLKGTTPAWSAPEVLDEDEGQEMLLSEKADVWSFAMVMS